MTYLLTLVIISQITSECPDIEWRFIGHLQTNKANQLLREFIDLFIDNSFTFTLKE